MKSKKILLLNPPARIFYGRDYFCSKVNKSGYVEHPVDLLILSGILSMKYKVEVLDALAEKLSFKKSLKRIEDLKPDVIIFITGSASWVEDSDFMKQLKYKNKSLKLLGIGDVLRNTQIIKSNEWIDALLLDFTTNDILNYLEGNYDKLRNMIIRINGEIVSTPGKCAAEKFEIPVPKHELFLNKGYTFPFVKRLPFTTVLTDYGCGFNCSFCIYGTLGFKLRKLENVFEELKYIHYLGIKELFIKDQTFGYNRQRAFNLCREMARMRWGFTWTAFCRGDIIDPELLSAMKEAGCHTLILGAETANENILKKYKDGLTGETTERAFKLCKKLKIRTVGTFIIGFPCESKESILATIDLAISLKCDFASFNTFVPKIGTPAAKEFYKNSIIKQYNDKKWDQSGLSTISGNGVISEKDIRNLLGFAVRRFYLRPRCIYNQILRVTSVDELRMLIRNGIGLIRNFIKPY